ncbi:MAG: hypothetical protein KCHDKBKB_01440 [Elusimicrobia bacterium]|nr:hypothetical protein [Elusimicrobiota bacterium]
MLFVFNLFAKLLKALNSEEAPAQLAAGFAFGAWMGLLPLTGLLPSIFLIISFLININLGFTVIAAAVYKLLAFAIDPVANQLGFYVLTKIPSLTPFWTDLYNMPLVPYTRFNNTIVMGSLLIGFLLLVPNYFLGRALVRFYRTHLRERVQQLKIMKIIRASSFYKYYETYKGISGQ